MDSEAGQPKYEVNSTVYVPYEGGMHYGAKVIKREIKPHTLYDGTTKPMWHYLVHYVGWNKKYDEWVEETGCSPDNPDAFLASKQVKTSKGSYAGTTGAAPGTSRPKMSIALPPKLKTALVQDHDAVKGGRLLPLPRNPTVEQVLVNFVREQQEFSGGTVELAEQVAHGLRNFFDRCVVLVLLYVEERAQADAALADGTLPSTVYGAEHLLRLFVKLPEHMPVDSITEVQYRALQDKLHDVLSYVCKYHAQFFLPPSSYVPLDSSEAMACE